MSSFAAEDSSVLSGLAKEIFYSIESDTYDLGNYTEERVKELIRKVFSSPLPNPTRLLLTHSLTYSHSLTHSLTHSNSFKFSMIKITFVVGGGKLVRSKYDENLPKFCVSALRELNYNEDKSAAGYIHSFTTHLLTHSLTHSFTA